MSATSTMISNVKIIDVTDGTIENAKSIIIDSGRIISIFDYNSKDKVHENHIDGKDSYVLPGLAEMHAHIPPPTTSKQRIEETLFLYLSNGITTIRGMLGDSAHLALRERAKSGDLLSPRIFTSSPSLNGNSVTSKEEAIRKVTKYKSDGYDFLKIHPGIQKDVFNQVVKTANEVGIPFAGHVPVDVGIRHALKSQYASIDHVDGFIEGLVPESMELDPTKNGFFGYDFTPLADEKLIPELVSLAKENKVWIVPTQSLFERWFAPVTAKELLAQEEMKYMTPSTRRNWLRVKNQAMEGETFSKEQWQRFDELRRSLIKELQENGHGILMGSDAPQLFNVPGFSIHHEIDGMQNAGMSELDIIQAGTINPATFFGMENEFGQIKEGFSADLIIVNKNPLENLDALKDLVGVMRSGQWISKKDIDEKLVEIAANAEDN